MPEKIKKSRGENLEGFLTAGKFSSWNAKHGDCEFVEFLQGVMVCGKTMPGDG